MLPKIVCNNFEIANITNNELFFASFYDLYPRFILNYAIENNLNNFISWFSTYNSNELINNNDLNNILISFVDPIYFIEHEFVLFLVEKFRNGTLPNVPNGENILNTLRKRIGKTIVEIRNMLINMNINIDDFKYFKKKGILNSEEYTIFLSMNATFLETVDMNRLTILME